MTVGGKHSRHGDGFGRRDVVGVFACEPALRVTRVGLSGSRRRRLAYAHRVGSAFRSALENH